MASSSRGRSVLLSDQGTQTSYLVDGIRRDPDLNHFVAAEAVAIVVVFAAAGGVDGDYFDDERHLHENLSQHCRRSSTGKADASALRYARYVAINEKRQFDRLDATGLLAATTRTRRCPCFLARIRIHCGFSPGACRLQSARLSGEFTIARCAGLLVKK